MPDVSSGVIEIPFTATMRLECSALPASREAVYVLHSFVKKIQATGGMIGSTGATQGRPRNLGKQRYGVLLELRKSR